MNRRGLGRGLGALLSAAPGEGEALLDVPVDQIDPNPRQPRKTIEPAALEELAASIRASGVIQPVLVRRLGERYQLIAGERRWRAARMVGLGRIPVVVRDATDAESLELALVENLLREDLDPIEEAEGYQKLLADYSWTQEELSRRIGRDRSTIANCLRLLRLPEAIQQDLRARRLSMGHARALVSLTTEAEQIRLRDQILSQALSVRATEDGAKRRAAPGRGGRRRSVELAALEAALQRALMTRVRIVGHERRGRIEIGYASAEELERLREMLGVRD